MRSPGNPLIERYWHLVAHRSELAKAGDYLRLAWALGDIVLFNDQGEIIAFDNLCPHRGTRIFIEQFGSGRAVCPYHGWSYRGGSLHAPASQTFDPDDVARARLNRFQTTWCGDFLFVGLAPRETLSAQLGDTFGVLDAVSRQITSRSDFNAFEFESDWRVAVENALETDHINFIHPTTLGALALKEERTAYDGLNMTYWGQVTDKRADRALRLMKRFFDIDFQYEGYWTVYVFPFAMISATFGYSYSLQNFFPGRSFGRSEFCSRLLRARTRPGADAAVEAFFESTAQMNRSIFEEDHLICRRVSSDFDQNNDERVFGAHEQRVRRLHQILKEVV